MIVAGIDIGSRSSKCVLMNAQGIKGYHIQDTGFAGLNVANETLNGALNKTNLSREDISYIVATGYGRVSVSFAQENISEISCHAKGAHYFFPSVRTILDMGGQDVKAISVDETGKIRNFIMNEKCAAGTGRFLELIGSILNVSLDDIGKLALSSSKHINISAACALYVKSEALVLLKQGVPKVDILAAIHNALANRTVTFLNRIDVVEDLVFTGGIGKNVAMVEMIREKMGITPLIHSEPAISGAVGAAVFALERGG